MGLLGAKKGVLQGRRGVHRRLRKGPLRATRCKFGGGGLSKVLQAQKEVLGQTGIPFSPQRYPQGQQDVQAGIQFCNSLEA